MKKAKIMLTALAVLAVVGGALAFKAQKTMNSNLRCLIVPSEPAANVSFTSCTFSSYTTLIIDEFTWGYCTEIADPILKTDCFKKKVVLKP